jgi:hypothetical protein
MENTTTFKVPDFEAKPQKPGKKIEKELLTRINRDVKCAFCEQTKLLNPDQYQKRFDYYGSEDAIARNFQCQVCETQENTNPFRFWFDHSLVVNDLANDLKPIFRSFINGPKTGNEVVKLQNETHDLLRENHIQAPNFEFLVRNGLPEGIKFNFPFIGLVVIKPLEYKKENKVIVE